MYIFGLFNFRKKNQLTFDFGNVAGFDADEVGIFDGKALGRITDLLFSGLLII